MSKLPELLNLLQSLKPAELVTLTEALKEVQSKADQVKSDIRKAEIVLMEEYPLCGCGNPITFYGELVVYATHCKPTVHDLNGSMKPAFIINEDDWCYDDSSLATKALVSLSPQGFKPNEMIGTCGKCDSWVWVPKKFNKLEKAFVDDRSFNNLNAYEWTIMEHFVKAADAEGGTHE